jgi:hypothetical protein
VRNDFHNFLRPAAWGAAVVVLVEHVHGDRRATTRRRVTPAPRRVAASTRPAGKPRTLATGALLGEAS